MIQMRAPNSTVIIVGTHFDAVEENLNRFPTDYLEILYKTIQERFVNIPDSDKKGLPRVVASLFISLKSKHNIKNLCNLIYQASLELKTSGRKSKLLTQKMPAIYLALEKIVVTLTDELRSKSTEPILKFIDFWNICSTRIAEEYGRNFRDEMEFRQAVNFLHENGIMIYFDDSTLGEYCFLDPPWLCGAITSSLSCKLGTGNHENSIISNMEILQVIKHFLLHSVTEPKKSILKNCIFKILSKFEAALPCQNKLYLISSSLPDEYLLRADYPGAKIRQRTKNSLFYLKWKSPTMISSMSPTKKSLFHRKIVRTFAGKHFGNYQRENNETGKMLKFEIPKNYEKKMIFIKHNPKKNLRRLMLMQYIPPGFWPRLITRILDDEKITQTIGKLFVVQSSEGTPLNTERRSSSPKFETGLLRRKF